MRRNKTAPPVQFLLFIVSLILTACRDGIPMSSGWEYTLPTTPPSDVTQLLLWGNITQKRISPGDTMFATTGRRLYVIGDIDGGFRPRSNPYDLYNFGGPLPDDPLANKLQGVWAQPVKALNGYVFEIEVEGEIWPLLDAWRFTQTFAEVQFEYRRGDLTATRKDFVPQDRPALFTTLALRNDGDRQLDVRLTFFIYFDLEDAWFTSLANQRNDGEIVESEPGKLIARADRSPDNWAVVVGGGSPPEQTQVIDGPDGHAVGQMEYTAILGVGDEKTWSFGVVVESESGPEIASRNLDEWLPQYKTLLSEKRALYETLLITGPQFNSPDERLNAAFNIARANMQMLEAGSEALGRYFYAGLENFPFWFGNDGAYSASGLLASGFVTSTKNHMLDGAQFNSNGRIPHQISPSGSVVGMGNAQETPQWVMALWDVYRWTGDREFLATVYPVAVKGIFDYTLVTLDGDGDGYPSGPGMVEREGLGAEKIDSAAYLWAALHALAQMADIINDPNTMALANSKAAQIGAGFNSDWWNVASGSYAMSLAESNNRQMHQPHWAIVVPLEVGLASPENAATTLATLQERYLNEWGLKHTVGDDERVWTLPTATLSRAAFRYAEPEMGMEMLRHLAQTLDYGSIGMYHELIPQGLGFMQLWSGATFVRGVVEDLMGVDVRADTHKVIISPQLPVDWDFVELNRLKFGDHTISVHATYKGVTVAHLSGPMELSVTYRAQDGTQTTRTLKTGAVLNIP